MQTGRASRTAFRVALRRAAHQLLDHPPVLDDPIAIPLLGSEFQIDSSREAHPIVRAFRAFMAARSRCAEDHLAQAVTSGVTQYIVLGAGLDTFAYRNPFHQIRVFEVDFPATQEWKRTLLAQAAVSEPSNLTFVPLDFEHKTLAAGLRDAGFDPGRPAFFGWLGVVPYLTLDAIRSTLATIGSLPDGSGVCFDYGVSPANMGPSRRAVYEALAARVAAAGEPFRTLFDPDDLEHELTRAGFHRAEQFDSARLNTLYFADRADDLQLPAEGLGMIAAAWV